MTTQNVGFTGYYNPNLMSFTTGTFSCDFLSSDADPWGFAWGIQKKQNSAGQDVYSFYMYEECGHNHWCIAYVSEWTPAKDGAPHKGPVYHSTIDAADSQYNHTGGKGSVGFAQGTILVHGAATVQNVRHRVTMNVTKNKITVTSPSVGIDASVDAPVQPGSFGPVTASNSSAFYYNLSMEAAEDNGAIKADFQLFDNGEPSYAGVPSDTLSMEDRTWLDPATKATIRNETWTVFDPAGRQVYQGSNPYSGVVDQEGEYRVVLEVLTSQGLTAKKTKYFTVSNASIVTVNYVTESGEKLTDTITYKGRAGKPYQTIDLSFNGNVLSGVEGEESGVFLEGRPISVTYSYKKLDDEGPGESGDTAQPVTARYVDVDSGANLCDPMVYRGAVGDPYTVTKLDFPGYVFVRVEERTDSVTTRDAGSLAAALSPGRDADDPTTKTGNFGFQARTITYYYRKDAAAEQGQGTILLRFVDENDVTLVEDRKLTGTVGDPATAALPKITKYNIKTVGGQDAAGSYTYAGTFEAGVTVVKVVYSPITYTASSVMVLYRDPDGNTIKSQVIDGNAGDSYTTSALDIPGYELVATPANASGTFAANSVTLVVYQYQSTLNKETEDGGKINIDTDDDGLPDVNVDIDGDGIPDTNVVDEPVITYTITTQLRGITTGASISPSANVVKGASAAVVWAPGENTYVSRVEVDGRRVDAKGGRYEFSHLSGDHSVVVTLAEIPLIAAHTTKGYYTITVNTYGVSKGVEASDSMAVAAGTSEAVTWSVKEGHVIKSVSVDGVKLSLDQVAVGSCNFSAIAANHVVDIVVEAQDGTTGLAPDNVVVSTKIEGGPGTITGGSTVAKGESYTVAWNPVIQTTADRDDPAYAVYEVESVSVNGAAVDGDAGDVSLTNIKENQEVVVKLRPVTFNVAILKYGDGTAKPSKTVYKGNHYVDISAQANTGSRITYLEIDGKEVYREGVKKSPSLRQELDAAPKTALEAPSTAAEKDAPSPQALSAAIVDALRGEGASSEAPELQKLAIPQDQPASEEGKVDDGAAQAEAAQANKLEQEAPANDAASQTGEPEEESTLLEELFSATMTKAYAAEIPAAVFNPEEIIEPLLTGTTRMDMGIRDIDKDHQIKVYFAKDGEPAVTPETLGSTVDIETQVDGGPGEITGGGIFDPDDVDPDNPPKIQWEVPEGYTPVEVEIYPKGGSGDPVVVPVAPGQTAVDIPSSILESDGEYVVKLKVQKESEGDDVAPKQRESLADKTFYEVASSISGGPGTVTATTDVMEGASHTVTWAAGERDGVRYRVAKVLIDGKEHPELAEAASYTFEDVASNHTIEVVLEPVIEEGPVPDDEKPAADNGGGSAGPVAEKTEAGQPGADAKAVNPTSANNVVPATGDTEASWGALAAALAAAGLGALIVLVAYGARKKESL